MLKVYNSLKGCSRLKFSKKVARRMTNNETIVPPHDFLKERSHLIDGKALSKKILSKLKSDIEKWVSHGNRRPHLSVVMVGDNPASELYIKNKVIAAEKCGITSEVIRCPVDISQENMLNLVNDLNSSDTVDAILVQIPCPEQIDIKALFDKISVHKDVDGFHSMNMANLTLDGKCIVPCTALAVYEILQDLDLPTKGLEAVVIGCSKYIGLPIFLILHNPAADTGAPLGMNMTTTICHKYTSEATLEHFLKRSDVIISAVGRPGLINGDLIKPGAVVIDVGISLVQNANSKSTVVGDVQFEKAVKRASYITPVPGGVGPVTVAMLMKNTLQCAVLCKENKADSELSNKIIDH